MKITITSDESYAQMMKEGLQQNSNYCPCVVGSKGKEAYLCPCERFRSDDYSDEYCPCGYLMKVE